jgi:hypothetical protein
MKTPDNSELMNVWERGAGQPAPARGLLLMKAMAPDEDAAALARWSVGRRDRLLLDLRAALFGPGIECLTDCTSCGEAIEVNFRIDDVRVPYGDSGRAYRTKAAGINVQFRLVDSSDLLALEGAVPAEAERQLLTRCITEARSNDADVAIATLPDAVLSAIDHSMSELDAQAEILLEVACPACSALSLAPFDIVSHVWTELDTWARCMMRDIHALASTYGWSEQDILGMTAVRRQSYVELISS